MPTFMVILSEKRRGGLTRSLLEQHVEHLRTLSRSGVLRLCGPLEDDERALQILEAASADEARTLVERDPFVRERYYQRFELTGLLEANEKNDFLLDAAPPPPD